MSLFVKEEIAHPAHDVSFEVVIRASVVLAVGLGLAVSAMELVYFRILER